VGALALRVTDGTKRYQRAGKTLTVFHSLNLTVRTGEVLALLGPSGCGKSTLLRVLARLEPLSAGRVEVGSGAGVGTTTPKDAGPGADGPERNGNSRALGIVFQEPLLFPWLTVAESVGLGLRYRANRAAGGAESVEPLLRDFGLAAVGHAYPGELSGGQAQRASLARTIVTRPAVLLLDEPFAALDPRTRTALQDWLLDIVRRRELTVVLVTHDVDEALYLGDRVALMSARPSTIVKVWEIDRTTPGRAGGDRGQPALRREIVALYQSDVPHTRTSASSASWVI
jgi:ABC-type nitrate/sulfonate/bicarbonate transport system ATPase subunit